VTDNQKVIVGGMITERTVKYTRNNQAMAFLTLEDLVGTVEIVVFPRDYEKYQSMLTEDARVLIQGRVSAEDDKASKLIFESVRSFDEIPRELWVQFANRAEYASREAQFLADLKNSPGKSTVVVYLKDIKAMKKLGSTCQISFDETWMASMRKKYGEDNVKVVERVLKNFRK
jgi:DNA polymerase-3 subunit alpha